LRIERSNFRLLSDISSKESTLQLVYDVLRLTPFFKAFPFTANVLEIYMQEFWATATVHHHSIWFKMDNKKHIVNLEFFREMLHICPRLPGQASVKPPFEEEILAFFVFLDTNTQQFGALLPIELTNEDIRNSNAYKEYYAVATGATPPKPRLMFGDLISLSHHSVKIQEATSAKEAQMLGKKDCHAGNLCEFKSDLTAIIRDTKKTLESITAYK
nr:hypothetical protein [Tanacetum cinerariifolium]